ncbi:hypothetical protein Rhe02_62010 [Rhizocola hellebori]|uniref:Uncharacterized protein n=1 Tax=Rhizocola hellebori TaxID=1392758 RepID=A0A8J3QEA1_9ACTN|nr:hypothetical protein [Rhizocola hellebori]GIH08134.1 hypothetical protein Rhe02_62010 [Rhizocola hellebori]
MPGRLLTLAGPFVAAVGLVFLPAAAFGAPAPTPSPAPPVKTIQITGTSLANPITVSSQRDPARQDALRSELTLFATQAGTAATLPPEKLGPKFTVVLSTDGKATEQYDLYPLATGGPRAYRPAEQPDKRQVGEAWFYGRISMPGALQAVGVPLQGLPADLGGGGGGAAPPTDAPDIGRMLGDWRNFMGLNIAVIIVVAAGVFALAYVLRRQV